MRRILTSCILVISLLLVPSSTVVAGEPVIQADLDGLAIEPSDVGRYYCHDRDYPLVHCFRTAKALEAARRFDGAAALALVLPPGTYVTIYSLPSYAGSYMHVTQNYDTLVVVGWNDRIRSYRGKNNGSGTFWTDWFATGTRLDFCCNVQVPILTASMDQKITSVYRR